MVSAKKKELVQGLVEEIKGHPVVAVVNFENLPARQLQIMRETLSKNGVTIRMARKKLLQLSLDNSGLENADELKSKIKGLPALLFSDENPFTLYATIQKNKSPAPAKGGQESPKDIVVKAGPTNFAPGPIISELAAVGIKTKVDGGKLAILDDTTVAKEGDIISQPLASMLARLDIQPMEVGLDLVAVWEKGTVFNGKDLHIDEAEYVQNFTQAAQWSMNLAVDIAYPTSDTIELLLQKAFRDSKGLAIEQNVVNDETAGDILAKVEREAVALQSAANIEVVEKPVAKVEETPAAEEEATVPEVEEVKEEPKAQEVVVETPVEEPQAEEPAVEAPVAEPKSEEPKAEEPFVESPVEELKEEEPVVEIPVEEAKAEEAKDPVFEESEIPESATETSQGEAPEQSQPEEESAPAVDEEPEEDPAIEEEPSSEELTHEPEEISKEKSEETIKTADESSQNHEENRDQQKAEEVLLDAVAEQVNESEAPVEEPKAEEPVVEVPVEEPAPTMVTEEKPVLVESPSQESIPTQQAQGEVPSAESLIKATMDKFNQQPQANKPTPSESISAEDLVAEEKQRAAEEKPVSSDSVEKAENLFKELMKKGTLREEN